MTFICILCTFGPKYNFEFHLSVYPVFHLRRCSTRLVYYSMIQNDNNNNNISLMHAIWWREFVVELVGLVEVIHIIRECKGKLNENKNNNNNHIVMTLMNRHMTHYFTIYIIFNSYGNFSTMYETQWIMTKTTTPNSLHGCSCHGSQIIDSEYLLTVFFCFCFVFFFSEWKAENLKPQIPN